MLALPRSEAEPAGPRELISGRAAAGPLAQVQGLLALGAAVNGALATLLPHPHYYNVPGLLMVQISALVYGITAQGKLAVVYPSNFKARQIVHDVDILARN